MHVIRGLHNLTASHRGCVATIGNFDGVHRGHQAILQQCREHAARLNVPLTVVVFEPQPREFFAGDQAPPRLTRLREKVRLLRDHGAEQVLCLPFNDTLRSLTGREFIDQVLIDGLGVKHLVVGDDFRFGCDRRGDFSLLEAVGRTHGFGVEHTRTFKVDDEKDEKEKKKQSMHQKGKVECILALEKFFCKRLARGDVEQAKRDLSAKGGGGGKEGKGEAGGGG